MSPEAPRGAESVVRLAGLTKRFGRNTALDDVTLTIGPGEVFGYLGPNGAGKTTTIRLLMGMLRPTSGTASVLGLDAWGQSREVHRRVGYVPGEPALYDRLTGHQHAAYCAHLRHRDDGQRAAEVAARLDLDLGKPARTLSRGNRQKLAVVLAVMSRPRLLVLDEPTSGIDPLVQQVFHSILREHTADGGSALFPPMSWARWSASPTGSAWCARASWWRWNGCRTWPRARCTGFVPALPVTCPWRSSQPSLGCGTCWWMAAR
ncbi:ABC transporter ATP-binding protein [Pseudarthrobacter sp. Fe7]|nr:ABC transporter ATP-binding protein [Pseudarthrobacter sp. Fe7]